LATDESSEREMRDGTLSVRVRADGAKWTLTLAGELDRANAATLAAELERAEAEGAGSIVIDMRALQFIDSSGIAVLVAAHRRLNDGAERIQVVKSEAIEVQRVMDVTGLARELPLASAEEGD